METTKLGDIQSGDTVSVVMAGGCMRQSVRILERKGGKSSQERNGMLLVPFHNSYMYIRKMTPYPKDDQNTTHTLFVSKNNTV
jgi:hypothetical protein